MSNIDELHEWLNNKHDPKELHAATSFFLSPEWHSPEGIELLSALPKLARLVITGGYRDKDLAGLAALTQVKHLRLEWSKTTTALFADHLACWTKLEKLELDGLKLTGHGLDELRHNKRLKHIRLAHCTLDKAALTDLAALPGLEILETGTSKIPAAAIGPLGACPTLRVLSLPVDTRPTDAQLAPLLRARTLRSLHLWCSKLTDKGISALAQLENLNRLELGGGEKITDEGAASLGALGSLKELRLTSTRCTGAFLGAFGPKLTVLGLGSSRFSDEHVPQLARMKKLKRLGLARTKVGDAEIGALAGLNELEELDLEGTKVTAKGLVSLGRRLVELVRISDTKKRRALRTIAQTVSTAARDVLVLHIEGTLGHAHYDEVIPHGDPARILEVLRESFERPANPLDLDGPLTVEIREYHAGELRRRVDVFKAVRLHRQKPDGSLGRAEVLVRILANAKKCEAIYTRIVEAEKTGSVEPYVLRLRFEDLKLPAKFPNPLRDGEELAVEDWRDWDDEDDEEEQAAGRPPLLLKNFSR
jgi:hypothetical protein